MKRVHQPLHPQPQLDGCDTRMRRRKPVVKYGAVAPLSSCCGAVVLLSFCLCSDQTLTEIRCLIKNDESGNNEVAMKLLDYFQIKSTDISSTGAPLGRPED